MTNKEFSVISELEDRSSMLTAYKGTVYNGHIYSTPFKYRHGAEFKCAPCTTRAELVAFEDKVVEQLIALSKEYNVAISFSVTPKSSRECANCWLFDYPQANLQIFILCDSKKAYHSFKANAEERFRDMKYSLEFYSDENQ